MRSGKPNRGPSIVLYVIGSVAALFGVLWTLGAFSITRNFSGLASKIFPFFGVVFVIAVIAGMVLLARGGRSSHRLSDSEADTNDGPDWLDEGLDLSDENPDETVTARLNKVEELRGKGLISDEEYFETRERILNEI